MLSQNCPATPDPQPPLPYHHQPCTYAPTRLPTAYLQALPIEDDVRIPFFIKGPGVPANIVDPTQINLIDLAPTVLGLAGAHVRIAHRHTFHHVGCL